jgi:hypothetical protein
VGTNDGQQVFGELLGPVADQPDQPTGPFDAGAFERLGEDGQDTVAHTDTREAWEAGKPSR